MHCTHISGRPRALGIVVPLRIVLCGRVSVPCGASPPTPCDAAVPDSGEVLSGCDAIATYVAGSGQRAWRV